MASPWYLGGFIRKLYGHWEKGAAYGCEGVVLNVLFLRSADGKIRKHT